MLFELEKRENSESMWFWKAEGTGRKEKRTPGEQQFCAGPGQGIWYIRTLVMDSVGPILHVRKLSLKDVK